MSGSEIIVHLHSGGWTSHNGLFLRSGGEDDRYLREALSVRLDDAATSPRQLVLTVTGEDLTKSSARLPADVARALANSLLHFADKADGASSGAAAPKALIRVDSL